jgi:phospholipid/cholesterol/gamma-HCH transport system substrate-binding protein
MERNANYALVGAVTLFLFMGLIIFVIWLAKLSFNQDYDVYDVRFVGPVRGLSDGGEVHFNGIKVGEVTKIDLDKNDPNQVLARIRVTSNVPIKTDSFATLEPQGITGVNYIQIAAGSADKPWLKETVKGGTPPVIMSQRSALSDLLEGGGTVLTRTIEALDRVNRVLSDKNVKTFSAALDDLKAVTAEVRDRKAIIADAQKALQSIDATAQSITELAKSTEYVVNVDGKRSLTELGDAAAELQAAAKDARGMITRLDGPTTEFATTGLPQLSSAIVTLQSAAASLDRLVGDIEQNPRGVVAKSPAKELEVKP